MIIPAQSLVSGGYAGPLTRPAVVLLSAVSVWIGFALAWRHYAG